MAKIYYMYTVVEAYEMLSRRVFAHSPPTNELDMFSLYCVKYIEKRFHSLGTKEVEDLSRGIATLYRHTMLGVGKDNPAVNQNKGTLGSLLKDLENSVCVELILRDCKKDEERLLPSGKMNDNIKDTDDKK